MGAAERYLVRVHERAGEAAGQLRPGRVPVVPVRDQHRAILPLRQRTRAQILRLAP